jgi:hypothetical protein
MKIAAILLAFMLAACASSDCGARALARVMGPGSDLAQLHAQTLTPARGGTLPTDMISAARRHGYIPRRVGSWPELLSELHVGREVIVLQNRRWSWWPQWHYTVVTGYDPVRDIVSFSDVDSLDRDAFLDTWDDGGFWGLVLAR